MSCSLLHQDATVSPGSSCVARCMGLLLWNLNAISWTAKVACLLYAVHVGAPIYTCYRRALVTQVVVRRSRLPTYDGTMVIPRADSTPIVESQNGLWKSGAS